MKTKTDYQLTIELRDKIAARIIEQKANLLYWKKIAKQSKSNSPEIVGALQAAKINETDIKKDTVFLACIDEMLEGKN